MIRMESQRRRFVRLAVQQGSWDWGLVGCFSGLAFGWLKGCGDGLVGESLASGDWDQWESWDDLEGSSVGYRLETWRGEDLGSWRVTLGDLVEERACLVAAGLEDRFAEDEA